MRFLSKTLAALVFSISGAHAGTFSFEILDVGSGAFPANGQSSSINNQGTVAQRVFLTPGFNTTKSTVEATDITGQTSFIAPVVNGIDYASPVINDAGQVLTVRSINPPGAVYNQLVRINADQTVTVLAELPVSLAPPRGLFPEFREFDVFRSAINNVGEVAARVRTADNKTQIVKFSADGSNMTVIDEAGSERFNFTAPDINDAGVVAYKAQVNDSETPIRIFTSDGSVDPDTGGTIPPIFAMHVPSDKGNIGTGAIITNDGTIVSISPSEVFRLAPGGDPIADVETVEDLGGGFNDPQLSTFGANNFGQIAYLADGEVFIDGERIVGAGDQFDGIKGVVERNAGQVGPASLRQAVAFNDLGQAVVEIQTGTTDENGNPEQNFYIARLNPEGATFENPLVPFASTPEGENDVALNIINGLGVIAPIFVDPIVATGFKYTQGAGGENFASLLIPEALPLGDDMFTVEFTAGGSSFSETLLAGQTLDFTSFDILGISMFSILGIDIAEGVDPTDPFIVGLTFVSGGFSSTLSIDAITFDTDASAIPLPGGLPLLLSGLLAIGFLSRRRA